MSDRPATPGDSTDRDLSQTRDDAPAAATTTASASAAGDAAERTADAAPRSRKRKRPICTLPRLRGRRIFSERQWRAIRRALDLSQREDQIIQEMFDDRSNKQIAQSLNLSPHTVHSYLARMYQKLGVRNRASVFLRIFETYLSLYPRQSGDVELLRDLFSRPGMSGTSSESRRGERPKSSRASR